MARDHHDAGVGIVGLQPRESFEPVNARQPDVEQHAGVEPLLEGLQAFFAARRGRDREAFVFEHPGERLANAGFVVNYKD